jgi:hypothetical protein
MGIPNRWPQPAPALGPFLLFGALKNAIVISCVLNFSNVSNIDQRLRNSEEHGGSITAPFRHPSVTESVALPPNEGEAHASITISLSLLSNQN